MTDTKCTKAAPGSQVGARAIACLLAILTAGLLARILDYPLNRDENLFLAASAKLQQWRLYDDVGFNHLPNLPYVLSAVFRMTGAENLLLAGRLVTFCFWLTALYALLLIGRQLGAGSLAAVTAMLLLLGNVLLLGEPGMLATNNFAPIPFGLLAYLLLLRGLDGERASPILAFLSGMFVSLAIGFKANYIFLAPCFAIAACLAPASRPWGERLGKGLLPLALGGIAGAVPVFVYLAQEPASLFAHTLRYFTELHAAYWAASTEPQVTTIAQRTVLAEQVWLSNATLLSLCGIAVFLLFPAMNGGLAAVRDRHWRWPLLLALALAACGSIVAFVPRPSFPQYFVPPIPFLLLAFLALAGTLDRSEQKLVRPVLLALSGLAVAGSLSRLLPDLPKLVAPGRLTAIRLHDQSVDLARLAGLRPGERVATLSPALALQAGLDIYPEFAAGPFVYRVARFIGPRDRQYYRAVSEDGLATFLDANPPAAILLDNGEKTDPAFAAYASSRGFRFAPQGPGRADAPFVILLPAIRAP